MQILIHNLIQVHIPQRKSSQSFVFKMKCHASSSITHEVLISKEIISKSYKEICSGEKKKVNFGFVEVPDEFKIENNELVFVEKELSRYIRGEWSQMQHDCDVLSKFFSLHGIEPNWLECTEPGIYNEDLGGWTGCMGKV